MSKPISATTEKPLKVSRPPVVVVMGHVDHGKTTLLDYIRKTDVVAREAGGITQHIGAYEIDHEGRRVTFLDTPGHEAFSKMRSRGARVADVAILVIAADDGARPQTLEALQAIQSAGIPYVVALNKIDKPNANPDKAKADLAEHGVLVEGWGGMVPIVSISAKTGEGIEQLLELVLLSADMAELTADPSSPAGGVVIESHLDARRGATATLLIKEGTMRKGEYVVAGEAIASVKTLVDFKGEMVDVATFSSPVIVFGFSSVPKVGDGFQVFPEKHAAEEEATRQHAFLSPGNEKVGIITTGASGELIAVPLVLKADVAGSLEAIESEIHKLAFEEARLNLLKSGVGDVSDDDVKAVSSQKGGVIAGFRVKVTPSAETLAQRFSVTIKTFTIIYELTDWLKTEMCSRVPLEVERTDVGKLNVLKIFKRVQDRVVFGGRVTSGAVQKGMKFDVVRGGEVKASGKIVNLQQNKSDVDEVKENIECGISAEVRGDVMEGDTIIGYTEAVRERALTPIAP